MSAHSLAANFDALTKALTPKPRLLPSFEEQIGPSVAKEVRIALRERQDRLEKAGDYEAQTRSINASTALGFERYTEGNG